MRFHDAGHGMPSPGGIGNAVVADSDLAEASDASTRESAGRPLGGRVDAGTIRDRPPPLPVSTELR